MRPYEGKTEYLSDHETNDEERHTPRSQDIHEPAAATRRGFRFLFRCGNLQRITPPELRFRIFTPQPILMQEGTVIEYKLRLLGVPLRWKARILQWQPPTGFMDEQVCGPYRLWEHTHRFYDDEDKTIIEDVVRYGLPFWPFGEIAHPIVRLQLERIFRFRQSAVRRHLLHRQA